MIVMMLGRVRLTPVCLLLLFLGTSGRAAEPKSLTETYEIYSALLSDPSVSHSDRNSKYVIADRTLVSKQMADTPDTPCLRTPQLSPENLAQIMSDFRRHKDVRVPLQRIFSLSKPYVLLSPQQIVEFEKRPSPPPAADPDSGAQDLIRLSNVFFNQSRTVAMVYVSARCGGLCGEWGWRVLQKTSSGTGRL